MCFRDATAQLRCALAVTSWMSSLAMAEAAASYVLGLGNNSTEITAQASTWTELKKLAERDQDMVIKLSKDFDSSDYGGRPVAIAARVTIEGNGAVVDASKKGGLFSMETANAALTLHSMTLANSYVTFMVYGGGAIYSSGGSVTITRCNFTRNTAYGAWGGGAITTAGPLFVTDSTFTENQAPSGNGGGAIYAVGGPVVLRQTSFVENSASNHGGAIYTGGDAMATMATISESSFIGNVAKGGSGGAISLAASAIAHVNGTTFVSNTAASDGGAIRCGPKSTLMSNQSTFAKNNDARLGTALFVDSSAEASIYCGKLSHKSVAGDPRYMRACLPPRYNSGKRRN